MKALRTVSMPMLLSELLNKYVQSGNRSNFVCSAIAEHLTKLLLEKAEKEDISKESLKEVVEDARKVGNIVKELKEDLEKHGKFRALVLKE